MGRPVFIGDEATAAAYRLAGFEIRVVTPDQAALAWRRALEQAPPVLLITGECAAKVPADVLDDALLRCDPPVVIVPDAASRAPLPDYAGRVRASLGIS